MDAVDFSCMTVFKVASGEAMRNTARAQPIEPNSDQLPVKAHADANKIIALATAYMLKGALAEYL